MAEAKLTFAADLLWCTKSGRVGVKLLQLSAKGEAATSAPLLPVERAAKLGCGDELKDAPNGVRGGFAALPRHIATSSKLSLSARSWPRRPLPKCMSSDRGAAKHKLSSFGAAGDIVRRKARFSRMSMSMATLTGPVCLSLATTMQARPFFQTKSKLRREQGIFVISGCGKG